VTDDLPGVLQLVPTEIVERRYSAGERLEAAAHEVGHELPVDDRPATRSDEEK
jgi:hypothetical protein